MPDRTDYRGLQTLGAIEWENRRLGRIRELARSLTHLGDAAAALPTSCIDIHRRLAAADEAIISELGRQHQLDNPFRRR
jgi:hypothetical protein